MDLLTKIKKVLAEPSAFFSHLHKEHGVKDAFRYLVVLALFLMLLSFLIALVFKPTLPSWWSGILGEQAAQQLKNTMLEETTPATLFGRAAMGYVGALVGSFVIAALLHVWILIFGGKASYAKTYQLAVYARTPSFVFGWIPYIGGLASIYSFVLLILGTQHLYHFSRRRTIVMYLIPAVIFILLAVFLLGFFLTALQADPGLFAPTP